ncbi:hypothetical protein GCM10027578_22930 [Spirosoma luteolum]
MLLSAADQAFIQQHLTDDVRQLLLRKQPDGLDIRWLAAQIAARQKARHKLPHWYARPDLVFPPALSVEQASSELTARYKASLVNGGRLLDLTGGMGVDAWAFAERMQEVVYVERQAELARLAADTLPRLGATNVRIETGDGLAFLDTFAEPVEWLYLDPHRRNEQGGRVVQLDEYEPNLLTYRGRLLARSPRLLVKVSPMIDLKQTIRQLDPAAVHVVAVGGEVREVLLVCQRTPTPPGGPAMVAVNLLPDGVQTLAYNWADETTAEVSFGDPQAFLYEPNAAVLKAGAFRLVGQRFGLTKLAPNSHLYTSPDRVAGFPGRVFRVDQISKPDRKALSTLLPGLKANLTVRNFPQTVADLRKKLALAEGGDTYAFATTLLNGDRRLLLTHKVDQ